MAAPGFIHEYTIRNFSAASPLAPTDEEGRTIRTSADVTVTGRINILSADERRNLGLLGEDVDMSALAPIGTSVDAGSQVIVAGLDAQLNGVWDVRAIRHAVIHLRILCARRNA